MAEKEGTVKTVKFMTWFAIHFQSRGKIAYLLSPFKFTFNGEEKQRFILSSLLSVERKGVFCCIFSILLSVGRKGVVCESCLERAFWSSGMKLCISGVDSVVSSERKYALSSLRHLGSFLVERKKTV